MRPGLLKEERSVSIVTCFIQPFLVSRSRELSSSEPLTAIMAATFWSLSIFSSCRGIQSWYPNSVLVNEAVQSP